MGAPLRRYRATETRDGTLGSDGYANNTNQRRTRNDRRRRFNSNSSLKRRRCKLIADDYHLMDTNLSIINAG